MRDQLRFNECGRASHVLLAAFFGAAIGGLGVFLLGVVTHGTFSDDGRVPSGGPPPPDREETPDPAAWCEPVVANVYEVIYDVRPDRQRLRELLAKRQFPLGKKFLEDRDEHRLEPEPHLPDHYVSELTALDREIDETTDEHQRSYLRARRAEIIKASKVDRVKLLVPRL